MADNVLFEQGRTVIIVTGASSWKNPKIAAGAPFENSATDFIEQFKKSLQIADNKIEVLDLFNSNLNQADQLHQIVTFVGKFNNVNASTKLTSILFYYVGHG